MNTRNWRGVLPWLIFFGVLFFLFQSMKQVTMERDITYSEFKRRLNEGQITSVTVRQDLIRGRSRTADGKEESFHTIPLNDPNLISDFERNKVRDFSGEVERNWLSILLLNFGPVVLFIVFWVLIMRQMQGPGKQAMSFGRSKAKLQSTKKSKVTFADVAGCDEAKEELQEIIEFLKDPQKFQNLGGKMPNGVLLYGAPGTGKTLLAKAVAGEAGVPFFSSSGSEFVEMFVGVGASRVRDLFEQGRKNAPCLLFVDEIDAVGRHRFAGIGGGHDEREQTLNQLLVEMDGFDTKEGVILIAATNRPDVLDPALLRPGRFDRQVTVPSPDLKGREEILRVHAKIVKLAAGIDFSVIARRTPGFVGADLANVINEAALLAARHNQTQVEMRDLEEAIERVIAGPERKSRMITEKEKKVVAYHESGHTLVAKLTPGTDPVHKVSIVPRGPALGYTLQLPTEDRYLTSRTQMKHRLAVLLGGRVAEEIAFKEITTGACDDLSKSTDLATRMVTEFGMSEKLGPLTYKKKEGEVFLGRDIGRDQVFSAETSQMIDSEIKVLIMDALTYVRKLLADNRPILDRMAERLIEKEVLDSDEVDALIKGTLPGGQTDPATA